MAGFMPTSFKKKNYFIPDILMALLLDQLFRLDRRSTV
jgi:hypothetical protein